MLLDWTAQSGSPVATAGITESRENGMDLKSLLGELNKKKSKIYQTKDFMEPRGYLVGKADQFIDNNPNNGFAPNIDHHDDGLIGWHFTRRGWPIWTRKPYDHLLPSGFSSTDTTELAEAADASNVPGWYKNPVYDCVGVPLELGVATDQTSYDAILASEMDVDTSANGGFSPSFRNIESKLDREMTSQHGKPQKIIDWIETQLRLNATDIPPQMRRVITNKGTRWKQAAQRQANRLENNGPRRNEFQSLAVAFDHLVVAAKQQEKAAEQAEKDRRKTAEETAQEAAEAAERGILPALTKLFAKIAAPKNNETVRVIFSNNSDEAVENFHYSMRGSTITKTNSLPRLNKTDYVFLFGTEFGQYTRDVITWETHNGAGSYWFPKPTVSDAISKPEKAYTKTTRPRLMEWLGQPTTEQRESGSANQDLSGILGWVADIFVSPSAARFGKKVVDYAVKQAEEKSSSAQAPTPPPITKDRLAELLRGTNPDAIFYVGS